MALSKEHLLKVYEDMVLIRRFEEEVEVYAKNGTIPGFIHLSIGQEAAQAGVVDALKDTDYKFPDHRGHGAIVLSSKPEERKKNVCQRFSLKKQVLMEDVVAVCTFTICLLETWALTEFKVQLW